MFENTILGIIGFLTSVGVIGLLAGYFGSKVRKYVKSTETEIDDEVLEAVVNIGQKVLDEKDLGQVEESLQKLLDALKETPEETKELEKKVDSAINKLKK